MTMLEYSGEAERLRQVARAHAAGDIDQEDYRQIRTAVLEAMEDDAVAVAAGDAEEPAGPAADAAPAPGEPSAPAVDAAFNDTPGQLLVFVAAAAAGVLALVAGMLLAG